MQDTESTESSFESHPHYSNKIEPTTESATSSTFEIVLADAAATQAFAEAFAQACREASAFQPGLVVYLQGDLGAGKSFFCRAFIQQFLPGQKVKSPTYTLVESYETELGMVRHFDLYRLCDSEELAFLGLRDLLVAPFVALVEWPSKGQGELPPADLTLSLEPLGAGRCGRLTANTAAGSLILKGVQAISG